MNPRRRRLGFILAIVGTLASVVLPLSREPAAGLQARPMLLALIVAAALLFAVAASINASRSAIAGLVGAVCAAAVTLALLRDGTIAGSAAAGFWTLMLAVWLSAALSVIQLASIRPRRPFRAALSAWRFHCCSARRSSISGK